MQSSLFAPAPKLLTLPKPPALRSRSGKPPATSHSGIVSKLVNGYKLPMRSEYVPEWSARLRDSGYPGTVLLLDFETYFNRNDSKYSMRSISTIEFIQDARFEVLGLGCLKMDSKYPFADYEQQTQFIHGETDVDRILNYYKGEFGDNLEGCTVVAQNAPFDAGILSFRYGIRPTFLIDILGLARHWDSRSENDLDALCKRWERPSKGDTSQFEGMTYRHRVIKGKGRAKHPIILPVATTTQEMDLSIYGKNDVIREWEIFTLLLPKLSCYKQELRIMQHTLDLYIKPTVGVDVKLADELTQSMTQEMDQVCSAAGATRKDVSGDKTFEALLTTALIEAGDKLEPYLKPGKKKMLLAIAKADTQRETLTKHPNERVRTLMAARQAVDSWPLHIARVGRIVKQSKAANGLLPVPLKYCGAHTLRWSGGEKINLQNLGTRGHPLVARVRELLIATDGYEMPIADLSAIEARVLAWIARQEDLVQQFVAQDADPNAIHDVYTNFASKILGWPVRKPGKHGHPAMEKKHKWARNGVGKVGILGCGYGMGPAKCEGYAAGAIDFATATLIVQTYRRENNMIVQFWRDVERCFSNTLRYGNFNELPLGLKFYKDGDAVIIELPCGRQLKYHEVRITEDGIRIYNPLEHKWTHAWGGYFVENIVQSMARNLLAEAIIDIEDSGIHIPHHVHDEAVGLVPKGEGASALKKMVARLSVPPKWASGLPLAAEGLVAERYGGH